MSLHMYVYFVVNLLCYYLHYVSGVEAGRCRHGYPRAFVRQPITESFINSGFMRLSCPYLVKEIDQLELTTGVDSISQLNALVAKSTELQQSFVTINQGHEHIRRELLVDDPHYQSLIQRIQEVEAEVDVVEATVGEESKLESTSAFTSGRITSDGSNSSSSDGYKENGCGNNDSNSTNNSSTNNPKSNHSLVSRIHANSVVGMRRVVDQIVNR